MSEFRDRLMQHVQHVANVGPHCDTEETTKQALILPVLDILGFSPYDPTRVRRRSLFLLVGGRLLPHNRINVRRR